MKTLQRVIIAAFFGLLGLAASAQEDDPFGIYCDCPEPTPEDIVCVEVEGNIIPMPSACIAECLELEIVEGDCNFNGGGNNPIDFDCDCPEPTEDDLVCVETDFGIEPFPSACFAECLGLTVVEGDCDFDYGDDYDYEDPWDIDCDCPEPTEDDFVCVETEFGIELFPSACFAECFGLEVVEGDCDISGGDDDWDDDWGNDDYDYDCDCDYDGAFELVCVETGFGIIEIPLCFAECDGLEIVECDYGDGNDDDYDDEDPWDVDCDCPEPTEDDFVCVETGFGIELFPSACFAECLGLTVVEGDCDIYDGGDDWDDDWGNDDYDYDCDCDYEGAFELVCVDPGFGIVIEMPLCLAECEGLETVDCDFDDGDGYEDPFDEECDCPEPTEEDIVCVETPFGIEPFPSACLAQCFGFEVVEGDCDFNDGDYDEGDCPWGDDWEDDWGDDWDNGDFDCDCDYEGALDIVCVNTGFEIVVMPACLAACVELEIVACDFEDVDGNDDGGIDDYDWGDNWDNGDFDCDCDYEGAFDLVCVDTGFEIFELPACLAECEGLNVVDCDYEDEGEEDDDGVNGEGVNIPLVGIQAEEAVFFAARNDLESMLLFPNPTQDRTILQLKVTDDRSVQVDIYSSMGQLVYSANHQMGAGQIQIELSITDLPVGSYVVKLTDSTGASATEQLVKTH